MAAETLFVLNKLWVVFVGLWMYDKKTRDKDDKERDAKLEELKLKLTECLTEEETKRLIGEIVEPLKLDQMEIKELLKVLTTEIQNLSQEMAVQNALRADRASREA